MIEFVVLGTPIAKGRPRFTRAGRTYTPKATTQHEHQVRTAAAERFPFPLSGALRLEVIAFMPIPRSLPKAEREAALLGMKRPATRPDADNIAKLIADALNGLAYQDDNQIVELEARKFYGVEPRTIVRVVRV